MNRYMIIGGERRKWTFFFFLLLLSGLLVFLDKKKIIKKPKEFLEKPILKAEEKIYDLKIWGEEKIGPIFRGKSLEEEVGRLQLELQRLAVDQNQLSSCLEENERMRKLLGAPLPPKWKFLPTKVIGYGERVRIDKGEKDGVKKGMVVVSENILVGRVVEVSEGSSLLETPLTPKVSLPVVIKRPGGKGIQARGILRPSGGNLILSEVLQSEDIQKGDLVVSGGDENWPADLLIGQISDVLPKSAQIYQKAQVRPLAEYDNLRIVFIVISN
jgi:rod shape-determining protein MreC